MCIPRTMAFPSRKEAYDSNTALDSSSRTSMNGALYRRSSKRTTIQSDLESISNSSVHTTSTVTTRKDLFDNSEIGPGGIPSTSHLKYSHSLEKLTFFFGNHSQSTIGAVSQAGSARGSTAATSTSKQETGLLNISSFEDGDESPLHSTPCSSVYDLSAIPGPSPGSSRTHGVPPSTPLGDPLTERYGNSQPFTAMEIPAADNPPAEEVMDRLEDFSPYLDLDYPVIEAISGETSPIAVENPPAPLPYHGKPPSDKRSRHRHKKSIRVIAEDYNQRQERISHLQASFAANVSRKRSTKLWDNRVEEVVPGQIPDSPSASGPGAPAPKRLFLFS